MCPNPFFSLVVALTGLVFYLLFLPLILLCLPFNYWQKKKFKKQFVAFLKENEGKNFFCYNNKEKTKSYIEQQLLPDLKEPIELVYLNGKTVITATNPTMISATLHQLQHYTGFPHLIKIREGQLMEHSINNLLYNVLNCTQPKEKLSQQIHLFFEMD